MSDAHAAHGPLDHHFETLEQQNETCSIGMWAFLVQEVMFFGGLFACYIVFRHVYPQAFLQGSSHLGVGYGAFNTVVLLGSSLTMALAVREAQLGRVKGIVGYIVATMACAFVFLGVKWVEYGHKYHDGLIPGFAWHPEAPENGLRTFFGLYFAMTGMHALHMLIGLVLMVFVAVRALRGRYSPENYIGVEVLGLYWHFVDLVWIFLFPLLYLLGRES